MRKILKEQDRNNFIILFNRKGWIWINEMQPNLVPSVSVYFNIEHIYLELQIQHTNQYHLCLIACFSKIIKRTYQLFIHKIHNSEICEQTCLQSREIIQGLNLIIAVSLPIMEMNYSLVFAFLLWSLSETSLNFFFDN